MAVTEKLAQAEAEGRRLSHPNDLRSEAEHAVRTAVQLSRRGEMMLANISGGRCQRTQFDAALAMQEADELSDRFARIAKLAEDRAAAGGGA